MLSCTVRWHQAAQDELANLWLSGLDREALSRSANEIDVLLRISPATKGRPFGLAALDEVAIQLVQSRVDPLPEDLRFVVMGPLEFYYLARELDSLVLIVMARRRRPSQ